MQDGKSRKRAIKLAIVVVAGLAVFAAWSAREWIAWQLASADAAPVVVGPARVAVPQSLPARMIFGADGDVALAAGEIGYDAIALTLRLTPLGEPLADEDAARTLDGLRLALLADEPGADLEDRSFGAHPGFVSTSEIGRARSVLAVAVAGGVLVRAEISVRGSAPAKWRAAADEMVDSLVLDDVIEADALWSTFSSRAWDGCGGGDVDACLWTARSSWQRGKLDGARAALTRGLERVGPIEALWEEAKAGLVTGVKAAGSPAPLSKASPPVKRLAQAVELHRLLGDLEVAQGKPAAAVDVWRRAWRFDVEGRVAERLLDEGARLVDEESAASWAELARHVDERFGERPPVALAAARVASAAGRYDFARSVARRVYDGNEDEELRRDVVTIPLSAPPKLEPLPCPRGTKARRVTTSMGTVQEACVDRAGKRQGPGRAWFVTTGYLLEEVSYEDDEAGAPDQRYWENGQLQRRSLVDATGAVSVERWDPFGRPVDLDP